MALLHAKTRRWTVTEYRRLTETGALGPEERVELIDGQIIAMAGQKSPHFRAILRSTRVLVLAYGNTHEVGVQIPYTIGDWSDPEPDFVLIPIEKVNSTRGDLPRPDLIIEVADTSLDYDRYDKGSLYASAGVPEYWILNVRDRTLEVYRLPLQMVDRPFGYGYDQCVTHLESAVVAPWFRPDTAVCVRDLMEQTQDSLPT